MRARNRETRHRENSFRKRGRESRRTGFLKFPDNSLLNRESAARKSRRKIQEENPGEARWKTTDVSYRIGAFRDAACGGPGIHIPRQKPWGQAPTIIIPPRARAAARVHLPTFVT
jgi:hypothetical protein